MGKKKGESTGDKDMSKGSGAGKVEVGRESPLARRDALYGLMGQVRISEYPNVVQRVISYLVDEGKLEVPSYDTIDEGMICAISLADQLYGKKADTILEKYVNRAARALNAFRESVERESRGSITSSERSSTSPSIKTGEVEVGRPRREATKPCAGCKRPKTICECAYIREEEEREARRAKLKERKKKPEEKVKKETGPALIPPKIFSPQIPGNVAEGLAQAPDNEVCAQTSKVSSATDVDASLEEIPQRHIGILSFFSLAVLQNPATWIPAFQQGSTISDLRLALMRRYVDGMPREKVATREQQEELLAVLLELVEFEVPLQKPEILQRIIDLLERGLLFGQGQPVEVVRNFHGLLRRDDASERYRKALKAAGVTEHEEQRKQKDFRTRRPRCPPELWNTLSTEQRQKWFEGIRKVH